MAGSGSALSIYMEGQIVRLYEYSYVSIVFFYVVVGAELHGGGLPLLVPNV